MALVITNGQDMMGEDTRAAYEEVKRKLYEDHEPIGMIERLMVDEMVEAAWEIEQIAAYTSYIMRIREKEHEDKIYAWWNDKTPHWIGTKQGPEAIGWNEDDIKALKYVTASLKKPAKKKLDGKKVIKAIHKICWDQGEDEFYDGHLPDFGETEAWLVPGENGAYEKESCADMYKGWDVARLKACLKFLSSELERTISDLIGSALSTCERNIERLESAIAGIEGERQRLENTKILVFEAVREELAPYRVRRDAAMGALIGISGKLTAIQAKRKGELAANAPLIFGSVIDVVPVASKQDDPESVLTDSDQPFVNIEI